MGRIVSALQSYEADHNNDLSSIANAWQKADGSTTSGFSGYVGKLSQVTTVGIWGSDATGWGAAQTRFNNAKNGVYYNNVPYDGVAVGHTCSDLGASSAGGSSSSSNAAVWAILSNGTAYCVDM